MHPVRLRCENSAYPDIPPSSRLADRVPQRPKWPTYFFVNPKEKSGSANRQDSGRRVDSLPADLLEIRRKVRSSAPSFEEAEERCIDTL